MYVVHAAKDRRRYVAAWLHIHVRIRPQLIMHGKVTHASTSGARWHATMPTEKSKQHCEVSCFIYLFWLQVGS